MPPAGLHPAPLSSDSTVLHDKSKYYTNGDNHFCSIQINQSLLYQSSLIIPVKYAV